MRSVAFLAASRACVVLLPCCFPSRCAVIALVFACVGFPSVMGTHPYYINAWAWAVLPNISHCKNKFKNSYMYIFAI